MTCRPPTIVGDQLRRGGKCAGLNPVSVAIQGDHPGTTARPGCAGPALGDTIAGHGMP